MTSKTYQKLERQAIDGAKDIHRRMKVATKTKREDRYAASDFLRQYTLDVLTQSSQLTFEELERLDLLGGLANAVYRYSLERIWDEGADLEWMKR